MAKRNIIIFFTILYALSIYLFSQQHLNYRSFVWFALVSNFITGVVALVVTAIVTIAQGDDGAVKNTFKTILSALPLALFHLFAATFLSFLANWSEFSLMTPEKALKKDIPWSDVTNLIINYLPFYFPYLLTKTLLFFVPKSSLHGGFIHIRDALLLILASFAVPLLLLKLSESFPMDQNSLSFYGISLFMFIPWPLFFGRDIFAHKEDKVPVIKASTQFPVRVIEKGPQGWGLLFMAFGLIFVFASFLGFAAQFQILGALILFIPFFVLGSLFFLVGLNMQWGEKEITISREYVSGRMRMLIPWPKTIIWRQPLIDYSRPSKDIQHHKGDADNAAYTTYEIKMNLKVQKPRRKFSLEPNPNIILYRAYHPDNLDQELAQYRQLFPFME